MDEAIMRAFSGLYTCNLIELRAMENFPNFDLNQDGLVSLEEAMGSLKGSKNTMEEFKLILSV